MSSSVNNIVIKFDKEIKGSSSIPEHKDWILLQSYSVSSGRGVVMDEGSNNRKTGAGQVSEMLCTKTADMASAELFINSVDGASLGAATLRVLETGSANAEKVLVEMKMDEVLITHFNTSASMGRPTETFQLHFMKLSIQGNQYDGAKQLTGTPKVWDLRERRRG
ncbi:type VI secretion system secreted protein Hcp [Luteibacter sp. Sphag1AF]|uniref:type VI secretion system tube protein Hcp n=1 Tax=Luteibacter sp. Sphag1AF TaxID=2587031 RepID=UPI00160A048A|nr:type VI secretion system tube protein Hcp [Luteibacter sp. Sphag1AF]MBB3226954.1 type VI secretion system secreted protein Hcp [Luteibacter sp. Sphag1AF]